MKDLRDEKITKKLVDNLGLRFTDRDMDLLNYEFLNLESDGEYLRVWKGGERRIFVPCKKETIDGLVIDDVERKIINDYIERTFKRNNMSGVYVEY